MRHIIKICIVTSLICIVKVTISSSDNHPLSRRKRYLLFPEGASFSVAVCMTAISIDGLAIFTEGVNWGIAYDLPNDTTLHKEYKKYFKPKFMLQRRHRRDLYGKMELLMNTMGYDGRTCIYRALCEASRRFAPRGDNLIEEIIRIVFKFPLQKIRNSEPEEHRLYHWASRRGRDIDDQECSDMFPCPISLIDMALGYYSDLNSDENYAAFPFAA